MNNNEILGDYVDFISSIHDDASAVDLPLNYLADHVCYRVDSLEEYEVMKTKLLKVSTHWLENDHHGRNISKFVLLEPLKALDYIIPVVELPAPSTAKKYLNGLEHVEFVVGEDYPKIKSKHENLWSGIDDSGKFNQPVYLTFDSGFTIKYHEKSIQDVIKLEGNKFIPV